MEWFKRKEARLDSDIKSYLASYLNLPTVDVEKIKLLLAKELSGEYKDQFDFLRDEKLENISIGIVPDAIWVKGSQPTESHADKNLILFKESYFHGQDAAAWMVHELSHCQIFNTDGAKEYEKEIRSQYPDNKVEFGAFSNQVSYLKQAGKTKDEVRALLNSYYDEEEMKFLEEISDEVFD